VEPKRSRGSESPSSKNTRREGESSREPQRVSERKKTWRRGEHGWLIISGGIRKGAKGNHPAARWPGGVQVDENAYRAERRESKYAGKYHVRERLHGKKETEAMERSSGYS